MRKMKGDPNIFAIEFKIFSYSPLIGYVQLWIEGVPFGDFTEYVMLPCFIGALEDILFRVKSMENNDFLKLEDQTLFDLMCGPQEIEEEGNESDSFDNSNYLILQGENFDDFAFFGFTAKDEIHFVWKLFHTQDKYLADYPRELFHKKVKISIFKEVVDEFKNFLNTSKYEDSV